MKKLSIIFLLLSTSYLSAMNTLLTRYRQLSQLKNSALHNKCVHCKKIALFFKGNIEKECDFLEEKLEYIDTTGGNRTSGGSWWGWIEAAAGDAAQKRINQAVRTILAGESETIISEEIEKLGNLAYKLAANYDLHQAAKKQKELQILDQIELEELEKENKKKQDNEKENNSTTILHNLNGRYQHISGMFDSAKLKHACLNCDQARLFKGAVERSCDMIEEDFKKTAEQGYLEFGFIHTTRFADKEKEHTAAISKILSDESGKVQFEELVKLNAYAKKLEKNYHVQEELKRQQESEKRWQEYLEKEKNKQDAGAKKDN